VRELARWAAAWDLHRLPTAIARRASLILADDLGAMLAGAAEPQVAQAREGFIRTTGAAAEATVFAPGASRLDRYAAAAANGMAATWCELDEGYRPAPCHAGAYLLSALLAEAEATQASVAEILGAIAVAYEITARFSRAFPFPGMKVHPHAAFACIGAAAGVSVIRRYDAATLLGAVTGAASMTFAGPFRHAMDGALVRNAWTSAGAWIGLRAADWAQAGITGIADTPYDVFVGAFGTRALPDQLTVGLGEHWAVSDGYHKIYACCQYAHSTVEASLELHARLAGKRGVEELTEIVVETHPLGLALSTVEPPTVLAAKFSIPHAAASVACIGTGGQPAFADATLHQPAVAELRRRVRMQPYGEVGEWPRDRPARVTWRFRDGAEWSATCESARGGADQPFDEATLREKIATILAPVFPAMPATLAAIGAGDPTLLAHSWRSVVAEMTGGGG